MSWASTIEWNSPAGRILRELIDALPKDREWSLPLFGSSPLQLGLEPSFSSADVDLFATDETRDEVAVILERTGLSDKSRAVYVQLCVEGNFRTSPRWKDRAFRIRVGNVALTLPHPFDILIAKLHWLADKDLAAFRIVIARTGHPTEEEMRRELQAALDLFRPGFDEEMVGDITTNTRVLWNEIWGKDINVRQEIIAPAIALANEGLKPDIPQRPFSDDLRKIGES
jgi:hypothetical protein